MPGDSPPRSQTVKNTDASHFRTDDLKLDLGARAARGSIVTVAYQGLRFVASMIATVVLARLLTPQDYGLVGMVAVVGGFLATFKDLGLASAVIQQQDLSEAQASTLFWINVAFGVALTGLMLALRK